MVKSRKNVDPEKSAARMIVWFKDKNVRTFYSNFKKDKGDPSLGCSMLKSNIYSRKKFYGKYDNMRIYNNITGKEMWRDPPGRNQEIADKTISKTNNKTPFYFSGYRLTLEDKKYLIGVGIDLTDLKQTQLELQHAHEQLTKINKELEKKVDERTAEIKHLLDQKDEYVNDEVVAFMKVAARGNYTKTINGKSESLIEDETIIIESVRGKWKVTEKIDPWKQ